MPKVIKIEPHLSVEELETGYRQGKEPVLRTHYQMEILIQRCRQIIDQPDFVHGLTNFHWWSEIAA